MFTLVTFLERTWVVKQTSLYPVFKLTLYIDEHVAISNDNDSFVLTCSCWYLAMVVV